MNQTAGTLQVLRGKDLDKALKRIFDPLTKKLTPEALEACQMTGINPEDLNEKGFEHFKARSENEDIAKLRFDHYEKRRRDKATVILAQANDIVMRKNA
jgi:hypothetical protein